MQLLLDAMKAALARLKAVHEAAAPGPWEWVDNIDELTGCSIIDRHGSYVARAENIDAWRGIDDADARYIALDHSVSAAALEMFEYELDEITQYLEKRDAWNEAWGEAGIQGSSRAWNNIKQRILRLAWYIAMFDEPTAAELAKERSHG